MILAVVAGPAFSQTTQQTSPSPRFAIELKFCCISGTFGASACDGSRYRGTDVISGEVEETEVTGGVAVYEGLLKRTTKLPYCEAYQTNDGDKICVPVLDGSQSEVRVRLSVWGRSMNHDTAWVEYTPIQKPGDKTDVSGACTTEMGADIREGYLDEGTIEIVPDAKHPLSDRLSVGSWQDVPNRPASQPDGWTLNVLRRIR